MRRTAMATQRLHAFVLLVSCLVASTRAQKPTLSYCSPENNAGLFSPMSSEYQSTGLCSDHCKGSFAFAVIQDSQCWCSNYVPADQVDTSDCNSGCPGISSEWCGNVDDGLYGYYQIPLGVPLGTSGTGNSAPRTTSSSSSSSSSSSESTSTSTPTRTTAPPQIDTLITTVTGQATTIVVTQPAATSDNSVLGQSASGDGGGVSGGTIAGIVIGVVGGLALIIGALVWFFYRRRRRSRENSLPNSFIAERTGGSSSGQQSNSIPSRQVSQMSQAGLLGAKAPRIQTSGFGGGFGYDPRSPDPASSTVDRRSLGTDQRLNPSALYHPDDELDSVSLHDNRDYSRTLRIANPDT